MPDYSRYPNAADVQVLLQSAAFWPTGASDSAPVLRAVEEATIGVNGAIDKWEHDTGWRPFLNTDDDATARTLTVDRESFLDTGVLNLNAGLMSLSSVTLDGNAVDLAQVYKEPSDAPYNKAPYWFLHFPLFVSWPRTFRTPATFVVTGVWGYCSVVPENVWQQILEQAARTTLIALEQLQSVSSISQDSFSKEFDIVGIQTQKDRAADWAHSWDNVVKKYKRHVF